VGLGAGEDGRRKKADGVEPLFAANYFNELSNGLNRLPVATAQHGSQYRGYAPQALRPAGNFDRARSAEFILPMNPAGVARTATYAYRITVYMLYGKDYLFESINPLAEARTSTDGHGLAAFMG
jgi:hypothetical protein